MVVCLVAVLAWGGGIASAQLGVPDLPPPDAPAVPTPAPDPSPSPEPPAPPAAGPDRSPPEADGAAPSGGDAENPAAAQRRERARRAAAAEARRAAEARQAEEARRETRAARRRGDAALRQAAGVASAEPREEYSPAGRPVGGGAVAIVLSLVLAPLAVAVLVRRRRRRLRGSPLRGPDTAAEMIDSGEAVAAPSTEPATTAPAGAAGPEPGLRGKVLSGIAWKAASGVAMQVSRIVVAIILARLLTPRDFGIAATVLVLSALAMIFTDPALGVALIQRKTITEADRSTVFWTSTLLGLLFTLIVAGAAGTLAGFYGEPEVEPLFLVFSLTFVIVGLQSTHATLLTREMNFRALELRAITSTLLGGAVGVVTALLGAGAWALIWQALTMSTTSLILLWIADPWRPRFTYSTKSLRSLGGMGLKAYGSKVVWFLNTNTDTVLIAKFLGPASLGAYALAFNLMLFPITRIAGPLRSVLFPAFSRIQDDHARLVGGWLRGSRLIAAVAAPAMFGMIAVAPDFVPVVLGEQWRSAVPVLQILAVVGLLQALQTVGGSTLNAVGRMGTVLAFTIASYAANVTAFVAGLTWGITGVATAYAIATVALFPIFTSLVARSIGSSVRAFFGALAGVMEAAVVMLVLLVLARILLVDAGMPEAARLAVLVVMGTAIYVATCAWRAPEIVTEVRDALGARRHRRAPSVAGAGAAEAGR